MRAYAARWTTTGALASFALVRFASADDGLTFDGASAKVLFEVSGLRNVAEATSLGLGPDGLLYVAIGDAFPVVPAPTSRLGKILRLDVARDDAAPEVWATGVHEPRGLDVDVNGDVWLTDRTKTDDGVVLRVSRATTEAVAPVLVFASADQRPAAAGGHIRRGPGAPGLVGQYVYLAGKWRLGVVSPFAPSGPPQATLLDLGAPSGGALGRGERGELTVLTGAGVGTIVDSAARPAPTSLLATRCWDPLAPSGQPSGVIAYDVTTPLWFDGATKERQDVLGRRSPRRDPPPRAARRATRPWPASRRSRSSCPSLRRRRRRASSARAATSTRTARAVIARAARPASPSSSICGSTRRSPRPGCAASPTPVTSASRRRAWSFPARRSDRCWSRG